MKITAILHATFLVENLAQARNFYEGVLGFRLDEKRHEMGFPGVWYDVGAQQIHLMQLPNPEQGLQRPAHSGSDRHVALAVDNLDALMKKLDAASIKYSVSKSGRRALFCRDIDDNALEFIEAGNGDAPQGDNVTD